MDSEAQPHPSVSAATRGDACAARVAMRRFRKAASKQLMLADGGGGGTAAAARASRVQLGSDEPSRVTVRADQYNSSRQSVLHPLPHLHQCFSLPPPFLLIPHATLVPCSGSVHFFSCSKTTPRFWSSSSGRNLQNRFCFTVRVQTEPPETPPCCQGEGGLWGSDVQRWVVLGQNQN